MSLPLHKFQLSLSTPSPLSFKQETKKNQKPEQVEATIRVDAYFMVDAN